MADVRCVFRAHYKTRGSGIYEIGEFEVWLPDAEASHLVNDREARLRMFLMRYPQAVDVFRNEVSMAKYYR